QIRGAGNLLGRDQSGHVAAVGYDLYVQMVSEAVSELKGEEPREPAEIKLELPVVANLPSDYVAREDLRLEAYRRLATVTSPAEVDDIGAEWADRYGPPPPEAGALLEVARLRAECVRTGVREVTVVANRRGPGRDGAGGTVRLSPITLPASAQVRLRRRYPKGVYKEDLSQLVVPLPGDSPPVRAVIDLLGELVPAPAA
ncbi:MAG TPA: TRCF domain-containing protein, partial [Acidimicrobiales bacterium]|nr:TRCF domain-containing protein [Acidimicrobiales bacterium]